MRNPAVRALRTISGYRSGLDAISLAELQPELREARIALVRLERKARQVSGRGPTARERRESL